MSRSLPPFRTAAVALLLVAEGCSEPPPETPPRQISASPFQYPEELWDAGLEGRTTLRIFVTEGGVVDSARVEESSGHPVFDSAAVARAHSLRFEPARRGTEAVHTWVLLPVEFTINATGAQPETSP